MDIANIIERVEYIRAHVIADDHPHALRQIQELLQVLRDEEIKQLQNRKR